MSTAFIDTPRAHIQLRSQRLEVMPPTDVDGSSSLPLASIPLLELERLLLTDQVQITSQALGSLLRQGVPVHWLDWRGQLLGSFTPPSGQDGKARLKQYACALDRTWCRRMAGALVQAKINNQRRLLQKLLANRQRPVDEVIDFLAEQMERCNAVPDVDALRGVEGAASAAYFPAWAAFLSREFPFDQRSSRPPQNEVNACLSFGYTLLYQDTVAAIHATGLDPALGVLHVPDQDRWSLALDLMEPFRPALVDALTARVFAHRMFKSSDFERRDGGVYLNDSGRRIWLQQQEARLEREFYSEHAGHRTSLRQQIKAQAQLWKRAITGETDAFKPFRLN